MNRKKASSLIFGVSVAILCISAMWFFILYGIANQYGFKPENVVPIQNQTKRVTVNYNLEIKSPNITVQDINEQSIQYTIDVGGILTAIISGVILMILSKFLNKIWPDKKQ